MKKFILSIICSFGCIFYINAQVLYGTTYLGGTGEGSGTIIKFTTSANNLTVCKTFRGDFFERNPVGSLIHANDGKLYGMTEAGGSGDSEGGGTIFSYDPAKSLYTFLKVFAEFEGYKPSGNLLQATNGKLYGMTSKGGGGGYKGWGLGAIFSFDPSSSTYTKLNNFFDGFDGAFPYGSLIQAIDGKLYGMTSKGGSGVYGVGAGGYGVIFSYDPVTSIYTNLKNFDNTNGSTPFGSLLQANDGKLYGMTSHGGSQNFGVIFSFDPVSSIYTNLKDFDSTNGANPNAGLVQASDGKLYGMTPFGGSKNTGVIFSFDISTSVITKLMDFDSVNGNIPYGSFMFTMDGKFYGTTSGGGNNNKGVLFSFDPFNSTYTKLKDLEEISGANPKGSLLQEADGKLYGLTYSGGTNGAGVIFSFDPHSFNYTMLNDFGNNNEAGPSGSLMHASDGQLYGMTEGGGISGTGVIYSINPLSSKYTKLMDFDLINGGSPIGNLIQGKDKKLYGNTVRGGSNVLGVIFSFDPSTTIYKKLIDFDNNNGRSPEDCSLMQAIDGKLYGVTPTGGTNGYGVLYSLDPSTSIFTKLKDFDFENGGNPSGSLIQGRDGKLYGMTNSGGNGYGVIFSFDPTTSIYTKLKDFDNYNGATPIHCSLMQASDGKLYGMTTYGGISNGGVIFSFDITTSVFTKLKDFTYANGYYPKSSFIEVKECTRPITYFKDADCDSFGNPDSSIKACTKPRGYVTDSTDCDDNNKTIHGPITYYKDADGDSFGNPNNTIKACTKPVGYVTDSTDCDDNNKTIHGPVTYYKDADCDGFGDPNNSIKACTKPAGYVTNCTDCDDANKAIHSPITYYRDADRDGFGDANNTISVCKLTPPPGYVKNNFDCDDHKRANQFWNEKIRMCHNGKETCVPLKELFIKLCHGWVVVPCPGYKNKGLFSRSMDSRETEAMDNKQQAVPKEYKLSSFPNPFAVSSTIQYELPSDSRVSIKVYDKLGRVLAVLVDDYKKAGAHTVTFKADNLSKGVLYYRMIATTKSQQFELTNKMIHLK